MQRVQELIQAALENGGEITLEAQISPNAVYRFFLKSQGKKTALSVIFLRLCTLFSRRNC